jgi:hypothetical protein
VERERSGGRERVEGGREWREGEELEVTEKTASLNRRNGATEHCCYTTCLNFSVAPFL